ncbi:MULTISPECIES: hypothetical protein [unclassified Corallococcus]|uniref:hypothetical protein n=1 Tax=unclassified Corallococcus TaxID=2685029 RepID=UPI001F5C8A8C|nr:MULTISPECIES: hypothetical protein [unclassified Corallococcus]WAS84986.1 hypothetical protein O0N60_37730 [Corallococcus sp. NCRR]
MMKLPHHVLLITLLLDGGTPPASSGIAAKDGGSAMATDAGGGTTARAPIIAEGIEWPDDLRPLATLDGPAVLAAHAALQRLLAGFPKEYAKDCSYTAKAMEVSVAQHDGMYFVEIKRNVAKCGWAAPGFNPSAHWYELYAVSPDGKVLARYPYHP